MDRLRQRLDSIADAHDLAAVGVTDAAPFVEAHETLVRRVADGLNGSLRFTFAEPASSQPIFGLRFRGPSD